MRNNNGGNGTYYNLKVVTGDDSVSVLDPFDRGGRCAGDLTLEDDVHGLVGVNVGRPLRKLRRNCKNTEGKTSQGCYNLKGERWKSS